MELALYDIFRDLWKKIKYIQDIIRVFVNVIERKRIHKNNVSIHRSAAISYDTQKKDWAENQES